VSFIQWLKENRFIVAAYFVVVGLVYHKIVYRMVLDWSRNDDYSHGFLVPLVSAYFFWINRDKILSTEVKPSGWGLWVVLAGILQLVLAHLASEHFLMRSSIIVLTGGALIYAVGWNVFKAMRLPIFYLFLMVPIPAIIYDTITMPLKLFVTKVSVGGLQAIGYSVIREGNIILLPNVTLEVADACSGLRSLMSLIALSTAFAFLSQKITWKRWSLIVSAVPIAIITNVMRVFVTGILAKHYGRVAAEGFFHEFAGMMVFVVAMALLLGFGFLLKLGEKRHA
jgi:exosortase